MARFLELKKPWGDVITINIEHISSIQPDLFIDRNDGKRKVVTISLLHGTTFTADIPYTEFMRLLIPLSLGDH
jgi:hypothetical protein